MKKLFQAGRTILRDASRYLLKQRDCWKDLLDLQRDWGCLVRLKKSGRDHILCLTIRVILMETSKSCLVQYCNHINEFSSKNGQTLPAGQMYATPVVTWVVTIWSLSCLKPAPDLFSRCPKVVSKLSQCSPRVLQKLSQSSAHDSRGEVETPVRSPRTPPPLTQSFLLNANVRRP